MALPVVIAWAEAALIQFENHPELRWGFRFELIEGGSGFYSQERLYGFCGYLAEGNDRGEFRTSAGRDPEIMSVGDTAPELLEPYVDEIRAGHAEQMQRLGFVING
jgi:hypothetical protein